MIGQRLGTYRLTEKLGEGGMGEVYRALDEMLDRDVALKMLKPELASRPKTVERFRAEAVALAKLDHPGIARIHGFARHDERWFIVMEFVRGETLYTRLARAGRLPWTDAVPVLCQLLDALEYAHRQGVVHRDMKPANVLVGPDGRVKVTDFGIARVLGTERATRTGHIVGTLEYMSPEQVRGEEVDGRADLYAVGILLYELLAGEVPFRGTAEYEVMMQHLQAPIPSVRRLAPDVPAWFDDVLRRALAKSLADRFPSAADFQVALESHAAAEPVMAIKPTRLAVSAPPRATAPTAVATAAPTPPTRLASAPVGPAPAAPTIGGIRPALGRLTWRQLTAAGAVLVVLVGTGVGLVRLVSGNSVEVASAAGPAAETRAVAPPPPTDARLIDAPAPPPLAPPSTELGGTPPLRGQGTLPLRPAVPRATLPPSTSAPAGAPAPALTPAPTPADSAPKADAAEASAVEFDEVSLVTMAGREQDEREVVLRFESERLVLTDADTEGVIRTLPYSRLTEVTYARSRNPVGKADRNRTGLVRGLAKAGSFFTRTPHWLTLEGAGATVVLKVDGDDVERMLAKLESRGGVHVERVSEK